MTDPTEQFRGAILAAGLNPPDEIHPDGTLHRFPGNGRRGDNSGWYVLHTDGVPAGAFGCWREGFTQDWCSKTPDTMTQAEREAHRQRVAAMRQQREADTAERQQQAAQTAATRWQVATPVTAHPYLTAKGVNAYGLRLEGEGLLIPMRDAAGTLHSLQVIDPGGGKRFQSGGRVKGCYHPIGKPDGVLIVCEGYATGASIHEATGHAVAVAFNAGNLLEVAQALHGKYPALRLILAADDDWRTDGNPGMTKAKEAAQAVDGGLAIPTFPADRPDKATDFNDLHRLSGPQAVRECIEQAVAVTDEWPDPLPLGTVSDPMPYPMEALPNKIRAAVQEVQGYVQAPIELVASSALSAVSMAVQGRYDIRRFDRLEGPVSLFLLTLADSGERKTTLDGFFTKALRDYQDEQKELAKPALADYRAALSAWEAKCDGIKAKLRKEAGKAADDKTRSLEQDLTELERNRPQPPKVPHLIHADSTPEALGHSLATEWPTAGVLSAEAGAVFGSHAMGSDSILRFLSLLNQLWDGSAPEVKRKTTESYSLRRGRLTVGLAVQEVTLREFFRKNGQLVRGTGFLARFLIAWPKSTIGTRRIKDAPQAWPALNAFNRRLSELLEQPLSFDDTGTLVLETLTLTPQATQAWRQYHDHIEAEMGLSGDLFNVRDIAAKSADNAARLAGLFHIFEGHHGEVGPDTFTRAAALATWHLNEARRFVGGIALPEPMQDAERVWGWLLANCNATGGEIGVRDIRQRGPVRDSEKLGRALDELMEAHRIRRSQVGKKAVIHLNPKAVTK